MDNINYDCITSKNLRDAYVINQKHDTIFELSEKLDKFDLIFKNILLAVKDFKKYYQKEINTINGNEYVVLGFDFIVDNEKNVQIIEINHRSNYGTLILDCDVSFFKDMILLLANNSKSRDLILI